MTMDCARFEELLFAAAEGNLVEADAAALQGHLRGCPRCRELQALLGDPGEEDIAVPADLLAGVLARTSRAACERVRPMLAERMAQLGVEHGRLRFRSDAGERDERVDAVIAHVDGCARCAAFGRALLRLRHELPELAERDPGGAFVAGVMTATRGVRSAAVGTRWRERIRWRWEGLAQRPRLALEGAYAAVLIGALLFGLPSQSLAELPARAFGGARQEAGRIERVVSSGVDSLVGLGSSVWNESSGRAVEYLTARRAGAPGAATFADGLRAQAADARQVATAIWERLLAPFFDNLRALFGDPRPAGDTTGTSG
jgi:hypothetical protein